MVGLHGIEYLGLGRTVIDGVPDKGARHLIADRRS